MIQLFNTLGSVTCRRYSDIPLNETLDDALGSQRVFFEFHVLVVSIAGDNRVGLEEELPRLKGSATLSLERRLNRFLDLPVSF